MSGRTRQALKPHEGFFALCAGPLAWFVQLCASFPLASAPCFHGAQRDAHSAGMARDLIATFMALSVLIALLACVFSWRTFKRVRHEAGGDHRHLLERGLGRVRFLALWGIILSGGSALTSVLTAVALLLVPPCA